MHTAHAIDVANKAFLIDGKPFFMFSGEVHYFRMPVELWKTHLRKAREAGINTISSYIPWSWHEFEEGRFDFEGKTHPNRNLIRFLELIEEEGLYFSARVGPVSNAEMTGEGVPLWLLENYPDIFIRNSRLPDYPQVILLAYVSPAFQAHVKKWYDRVLPVVAGHQLPRGGNVIMVQLCNEIAMIHWLAKGADHQKLVTRMYQDFLRARHGSIEALNRAHGTSHSSFEEIAQPDGDLKPGNWGELFDWAMFYRRYYATYYNQLLSMAEAHGITVPHAANIPQFIDFDTRGRGLSSPMTTSMFRDFSKLSPKTIFGGAYQMRRLDFENFHDVAITSEITGSLDPEAPTICAELQTGIMRDRPRLYPSDVELNIATSVAHGLNGLNCYMLSSGQNHTGIGLFGEYHDWQAPVSLDGSVKPHFEPIAQWGRFIRRHGSRLAATRKVSDTNVGFYLPYYATEYFTGPLVSQIEFQRNLMFYDGFVRLLQLAGYNFSLADLMAAQPEDLARLDSLCVFSLDAMDEATQAKLAGYVRGGGKLLVGPRLPSRDLNGAPCALLADALGLKPRERQQRVMAHWGKQAFLIEFTPFQVYEASPGKPLIQTLEAETCAAHGTLAGGGRWLAYGVPVPHSYDYQVPMIREWMETLGVGRSIEVQPWDLQATLRWDGRQGFLFVFNYHDVPKQGSVRVRLDRGEGRQATLERKVKLGRRSAMVIPVALKGSRLAVVA